jgi:pimeloyl-ACP methyl ester carboxylesterase
LKRRVNSSDGSHGHRRLLVAGLGAGLVVGGVVARRLRTTRDRSAPSLPEVLPDSPIHRAGAGSPLLLLHGFSVTWRTWKPVLEELERHHDVIAPTMLGHSGATAFGEGVLPSIDALVDGVEAELDRLGLDTVHIAGNSMGGWVALELARRGRARSVVAFSPAGAWNSAPRMAMLVAGFRVALAGMTAFGHRAERLALTPSGRRRLAGHQCEHPERLEPAELIADIRAIKASPALRTIVNGLTETPLRPLPAPGCPIRIVWAQRDRVIPFEHYGAPLMRLLPTAELVRLDGVGHVPMIDDPDAVARLILEVTTRERVVKLHGERGRPGSVSR